MQFTGFWQYFRRCFSAPNFVRALRHQPKILSSWLLLAMDPLTSYLASSGVTSYLRDALVQLEMTQPANPYIFLSSYFVNATSGTPPIERALSILRSSKSDGDYSISLAYSTVSSSKANGRHGLLGQEFTQLLGMLVSDLPHQLSDVIMARFRVHSDRTVSYHKFRSVVIAVLLVIDTLSHVRAIFDLLSSSAGVLPKEQCDLIIRNQQLAIRNRPPEPLFSSQSPPSSQQVTRADFLAAAATVLAETLR